MIGKFYLKKEFLLYTSFCIIPFSYFELFGTKLSVAGVILILLFILINLNNNDFKKYSIQTLPLLIIFFISILFIAHNGNFRFQGSFLVFMLTVFWVYFSKDKHLTEKLIELYITGAFFCSIGIILQAMAIFAGYEIWNFRIFPDRLALSFIWNDYSFISLYIISAIPLIKGKNYISNTLIITTLIIGSILTSARTGLASIIILYTCIIIKNLLYSLLKLKISKINTIFITTTPLILFLIIIFSEKITGRTISFSSSGRIEGYSKAIGFILENPFLGALFDYDYYSRKLDIEIPHNLFIYIFSMGGLTIFLPFFFWLLFLIFMTTKIRRDLANSFAVIIIGMQFIPSVFSAYFFAYFISIVFHEYKNINCKKNISI